MNVSELENLVAVALGQTLIAQQESAPVLDECVPGMVNEAKRRQLQTARFNLARSAIRLDYAAKQLQRASVMLAQYLDPSLSSTDNDPSPDSQNTPEAKE